MLLVEPLDRSLLIQGSVQLVGRERRISLRMIRLVTHSVGLLADPPLLVGFDLAAIGAREDDGAT